MEIIMNNHNDIPAGKLKEFQFEIETWKQSLNSRMNENALMKIRLSDILKNKYTPAGLEEIEAFQAQFISQDEHILMLRNDVAELYDLLNNGHEVLMTNSNQEKIVKMRGDMIISKNQFNILKSAFDDFQNKIYRRNGNEN